MKFLAPFLYTLRFWIIITLLSIVFGTLSVLAGCVDTSGNTSHHIASLWARLICRLNGIRVEIIGLENVCFDHAQVFVANHQSYFDIFALTGYLPAQIRWMAKSSLFWIPFVGWAMYAEGSIAVNRQDRKNAYKSFLACVEKIRAGYSVVIFPEGTRSVDGTLGAFKKGGQLLAARAQAPMVPVTIIGSGRIIKKNSIVLRPGPVRVIISPPLAVEELSSKKQEQVLEDIRDIIQKNLEENTL
ncbi:MAG: lysophospholipid acyltransferase family protein [Nitrospinales bacterium]